MAFDKERKHLPLARRQSVQNSFCFFALGVLLLQNLMEADGIIDGLKKIRRIEWLLDKMPRPGPHGLNRRRHVSLAGQKNERGPNSPLGQSLLKRKTTHAR